MRRIFSVCALLCLTAAASAPEPKQLPPPANLQTPPVKSVKTSFTISSVVLKPGTGKVRPGPTDTVTVNYTGWTSDGKTFDTTSGSEPRRFWIPEPLAYRGRRAPYGTLVFDIERLSIRK